ncbi:peptide/nickel transport system ATP-binding protein [Streptacidiphilus sp. MAP12-33]|uniref:ABC transporter ATP-binding protein n=1 Tax=Streptacidiphilus sp. MAP12-33 TaxID=3156266 RepID=UPI003512DC61
MSLLEVSDLHVSFRTSDGDVQAVRGVSFELEAGRTLGIVGESGSGKSVCTQTLLGLTTGARVRGIARFEGEDLLAMGEPEFRRIRGAKIAAIFQDPLSSLHPLYKVGWQIVEMIRAHEAVSKAVARRRAIDLLGQVGIPHPAQRVDDYPHQFSGGMRQRALIAMALALEPQLVIADEPTTALDATVQAQILDLLLRLQQENGMALIMITHDLGVIAGLADDVLVMYAGRAAERADRRGLYYRAHHPYTNGLLESIPSSSAAGTRLRPIAGQPPSLIRLPSGCAFHPRCEFAMDRCRTEQPDLAPVDDGGRHTSACWLPGHLVGTTEEMKQARQDASAAGRAVERVPGQGSATKDAAVEEGAA